ncbi:hypothetical protein HK098_001424 [Nowakowskiella sp. JEL0407]|nr:hypothetical protein HK098_001424 [Nowakowskiella sp. JEL0407]
MVVLCAFVGKPSAGKSSFLNAGIIKIIVIIGELIAQFLKVSDAAAKVGNFPFTTIEPNHAVAYLPIPCPCSKFNKSAQCSPRYGRCENGTRYTPLKILDVAGLVPGASEGRGLGNKFLDDLRTADLLIHVVDVSGTTDENGKVTQGYDPINDVDWLQQEIRDWVYNNLHKKWGGIVRRHISVKATLAETFQSQFSGYGANLNMINKFLDALNPTEPLNKWDDQYLLHAVNVFVETRFPTVIVLNKVDLPDADKNIDKICRKYDSSRIVLGSALSEIFLRKLHKQKFIKYIEGTDQFLTAEDQVNPSEEERLKVMDEKTKKRLEKVQDLVLFRYGTTGVLDTLKCAVKVLGLIPAFPVRNINNFTSSGAGKSMGVFRDCIMVKPNTTVREFAKIVHPDIERYYLYAETVGGRRLAEDELITTENNIISFKTSQIKE